MRLIEKKDRAGSREALPYAHAPGAAARYIVLVLESQGAGPLFHRLRLAGPAIARAARPGQFVHVLPQAVTSVEAHDPLLRRAFSIMGTSTSSSTSSTTSRLDGKGGTSGAGATQGSGEWFEILFRIGGRGTSLLARSRVGDELDVLGPLGNGFGLESASQSGRARRPLLLVGGGIGVPPLIFAAQVAQADFVSRETGAAGARFVEAFVGARTSLELVGVEALRQLGVRVHIATDDGSGGQRGLVTQPLRARLQEMLREESGFSQGLPPASSQGLSPLVCACGPWAMLKAVAQMCAGLGVECCVSLEENMPCGIGVCNGCVVPMLDAPDEYGKFQRICVHGPVLDGRAVDWGGLASGSGSSEAPTRIIDIAGKPEHEGASQ